MVQQCSNGPQVNRGSVQEAFAQWIREKAADPRSRPEVVISGGWEQMRWERWLEDPHLRWEAQVIDTSELSPEQVTARALSWIRGQLA